MSFTGSAKKFLREQLPYSSRLFARRLFVGAVAALLRLAARAHDTGARLVGLAETHGLDLPRAWDARPPRTNAAHAPPPFGARDFLLLLDTLHAPTHDATPHAAADKSARDAAARTTRADDQKAVAAREQTAGAADQRTDAPARRVRASVVLVASDGVERTFQTLRSLLGEIDSGETELIVVDDASADETPRLLAHFSGLLRAVTNERAVGPAESRNRGAALARGEHLVFLGCGAEVQRGWLRSLVETAEREEAAGAVGSLVFGGDGRVSEAGRIVWRDAGVSRYGRGRAPGDRRLSFAREVDCCSSTSLLVRRDLFEQLGGFDARLAPARDDKADTGDDGAGVSRAGAGTCYADACMGYADADICFGVRSLGRKVVFQPLSRVVLRDETTGGGDDAWPDQNGAGEGLQSRGEARERFRAKWREALEREHSARGEAGAERAADRRRGPAVLVVNDRLPTPDRDAGSARIVLILGLLAREARPVFVSLNKRAGRDEALERELWRLGVETSGQADFLADVWRGRFRVAVLSRAEVAEALLPALRRADKRLRLVFDMVDAHFIRLERERDVTGDARAAAEAARYRELETRVARACDLVWCASPEDAAAVERAAPGARTEVIPTIHEPHTDVPPFEARDGLLFVGNFSHQPNADAFRFFMRGVFPAVRERLPGLRVDVAGPNAPEDVAAYGALEGVRVLGFVPSLEPLLRGARVFVAPLRFGAGVKGKIGEALAHGLPVVTTSVGAEGMGLADRVHAMIRDDPRELADAIVELHTDRDLWRRLSEGGREHVERRFSPRAVGRIVRRSILRLSGGPEEVSRTRH
jgi:O-antigen biosynthesis protein